MRPNSSPSSIWPLGVKSNSKTDKSHCETFALEHTRLISWITWSITWFLSNQLHYLRLALISNWLGEIDKKSEQFQDNLFSYTFIIICGSVCTSVSPDHVRVWSVGQSECSSIVFLVELGLFKVQLVQTMPNVSTFLQSLVVLRELQNNEGGKKQKQRPVTNVERLTDLMNNSCYLHCSGISCHSWSGGLKKKKKKAYFNWKKTLGEFKLNEHWTGNISDCCNTLNTHHKCSNCVADLFLLLLQTGNFRPHWLELLPHTHLRRRYTRINNRLYEGENWHALKSNDEKSMFTCLDC